MVHHVLTRTARYAAVWAEPIRTVAQRHGVSDVCFAKACCVAGAPVPPRAYWSQRKQGRPTPPRPFLPPRSGGEQVVIALLKRRPASLAAAAADVERSLSQTPCAGRIRSCAAGSPRTPRPTAAFAARAGVRA